MEAEQNASKIAEVLCAASLALTQTLGLDTVLDALLDHLGKLVPYDSACVMLLEGDSRLVIRAMRGYDCWTDPEQVQGVAFDARSNPIFRTMFATQKSVLIGDTNEHPGWDRRPGGKHVRNWLGVPLLVAGTIIGFYSLDKCTPGCFAEEDLRLAQSLAGQAAVAIQNAKLFEQAQRHAAELESHMAERRRAEERLRESERRYRELIENANDIIFTVDLEWNFISANRKAEEITGYEREKAVGINIVQIIAPEYRAKARQMLELKLARGMPTTYELEIVANDGRRIPVEVSTRLIHEDGKPVAVQGIARDVTERKRLEEQLRQAQKMEAIGRLAGGIAHDFNNVVGAMIGWAELGLKETSSRSAVRRRLRKIRDQGRHAAELIQQLLAFASRQILEPSNVNLNQTVTSLADLLESAIGEQIEVKTALAPDLFEVWADPGQLQQVLMNLCLNARDAMPHGGRLWIKTQNVKWDGDDQQHQVSARPGHYVLLSVSDTGVGMGETTIEHIFEPFFTTKEGGKGTGLGLAVVYGIVKQHDGFVCVQSKLGQGTTFCVYLPASDRATEEKQERRETETVPGGTETILVAEDHEGIREVAREVLESLGYKVLLARNGEEAVQMFQTHRDRIDLVFLDMVLPKLGGSDAYTKMYAAKPSLAVVFTTGYSTDAGLLSSTVEKGLAVLQKPYSPDMLGRKVRETLDRVKGEVRYPANVLL